MIYLDNAATTQVCPEAAEAAVKYMTEAFGNPSSTHGPGRTARDALKRARGVIASSLGAAPEEVFFTSGGSEGDNWAIRAGCHAMRRRGRHIVSSLTEHDAVLKTLDRMEADGWAVTRLKPDADGAVSPAAVAGALRPDTVLVSVMLVNNETGAVSDIAGIRAALKAAACPALLHTDAVQGYMKLPYALTSLGADMITLSAHKLHAPKGVGALYVRKGLRLPPLILGGGQEGGLRSGTENMPGICAFAAAVRAAKADAGAIDRMAALRAHALEGLRNAVPELVVNGCGAAHILSVSLPGYKSEVIMNLLDRDGICVSRGSACKKGARSHVLAAMGLPPAVIDGTIRVSLSRFTTEADVDAFVAALAHAHDTLYKAL